MNSSPIVPAKGWFCARYVSFGVFGGYKNGLPIVNLFPRCFAGILGFILRLYGGIGALFGQQALFCTCRA
jgi:hypothetical protein